MKTQIGITETNRKTVAIIIELRKNIHPFANDFITGPMEEHEKLAWFLRSHL